MTSLQAILLGILQGITEFLPVSSSAHLELIGNYFNIPQQSILFDLTLHAGTLLAIILFYRVYIKDNLLSKEAYINLKKSPLVVILILSTIPIGLFYLLFNNQIDTLFKTNSVMATTLIIGGIVLLGVDNMFKDSKLMIKNLSNKSAFLIGVFQSIALIRGVSRSGSTIIGGALLGLKKSEAIKYAFLTGIFSIGLSVVKLVYDLLSTDMIETPYHMLIIGFISSFLVGLLTMKFFLNFIKKFNFKIFGFYRILLGLLIIIYII